MKIKCKIDCVVINATSEEYTRKDGTKGVLNQIALDCGGQAGTLPCTEDVAKFALKYKYKPIVAWCEYNDQYRTFRVLEFEEVKPE